MDIEEEINKILNSIKEKEFDSLDDIEELRQMAIDKLFSEFSFYEKNKQNKIEAEEELESYEFIDIEDIKKGDYLRYFNLRRFYDLKLVIGGTVLDPNINNTGKILFCTPYGVKIIKPNIFFKKINTEDLVKMKLIQIANKV